MAVEETDCHREDRGRRSTEGVERQWAVVEQRAIERIEGRRGNRGQQREQRAVEGTEGRRENIGA